MFKWIRTHILKIKFIGPIILGAVTCEQAHWLGLSIITEPLKYWSILGICLIGYWMGELAGKDK